MNVKKIVLPLVAAIIAVAGVFAMGAKKNATSTKKADTTWYFIADSTSEASFKNANNWSKTNNNDPCGNGDQRPCSLTIDASNQSALQSYLTGLGSTSVLSVADETKQ